MMKSLCFTPTSCAANIAGSIWSDLADQLRQAAGQMVTTLFSWWATTPGVDVDTSLIDAIQGFVIAWVAVPVAVLALIAAVTWGVMGGGTGWVRDAVRGLIVFGVVAGGSLPLVSAMQDWATELARALLHAVPTRDVGGRYLILLADPAVTTMSTIFWSLVVLVVSCVQYLIMLFRDGAVLVLTLALPVAAAGQFTRASMMWLPRLVGWLLAFILVKPAAALIYYLGLSLLGQGKGIHALATGVCLMLTAIFSLPALLRLVTFTLDTPSLQGRGTAALSSATGLAATGAQISASRSMAAGASSGPTGAAVAAAPTPAGPVITGTATITSSTTSGGPPGTGSSQPSPGTPPNQSPTQKPGSQP